MEDIELSQLKKITDVIKQKFNYDFANYAMSSFKRRVQRVLEIYKYSSVEVLIEKLQDGTEAFFQSFLSEITVNVTEMFRDPTFWAAFRETILPLFVGQDKPMKIWHAGCSSGEEVFSMAIILKEINALDKAHIVATDIDQAVMQKAREGVYLLKNMELNQKNYLQYGGNSAFENYYKIEGNRAVMDKDLVKDVIWQEHNLVEGHPFDKFDIIICRNVMIYFNQTLQNQVLKMFHESLVKYGFLIVGSKESLIWCDISNKFIVVNNEEKIYKKIKD